MLLYKTVIFKYKQDQLYFSLGVLVGIILLTVIINLVLFIFKRDKLHLFYSLYALSAILVIMVYGNLDAQFLFPTQTSWNQISRITSSNISLFLLFIVTRIFLRQKPTNSRYYYLGSVMMFFYIATPIINIITTFYSTNVVIKAIVWRWTLLVILAAFPIAILTCIEKIRQGFKPALFYLVALSVPILGGVMMAFYLSGLNPINLHPNLFLFSMLNPLDIGLGFEAVIICIGILYRYNLDRKEKDKLSVDLEKEKTKLAEQVLFAQEDERKRIAEDLHDELGGNLAAIKMSLLSLKLDDKKEKPLMQLIDSASTNARNISHNLMPPEFKDTELHVLLNQHYQRLNNKDVLTFYFHCSGTVYPFNMHKKIMLYRIILEITNNIIKHSYGSEATIQLIYYDKYLHMMAEDNGKGFCQASNGGIGLRNVHSRISYLKGTIAIDSSLKGTTITIYIPYQT
jgi:signal transduction histidine kinase